ncbi:MAG: hypothetical protein ACRCZ0_07005 [Cetobacterium sp.]
MASKGIEKIVSELLELGYSERKIINRLKDVKESLVTEDRDCFCDSKEHNKMINGLLFGGRFCIEKPSMPLLGLVKAIKNLHGSEFAYYVLYSILTRHYFNNQIYDKCDNEKCNWLMYLIKDKQDRHIIEFKTINRGCNSPL